MNRNRDDLLEQLKSCCKQRTDGDWAFLAAAAGEERCVQQVYNILASYSWHSNYPESMSYPELRVISISISQPELLRELLAGWEREPDSDRFEGPGGCSKFENDKNCSHIYVAGRTARNFFKPQQLDPTAEPWSWEEYASKESAPKNLINRPLKETILTLADIEKSVKINRDALKALRTQAVKIDLTVFEHYSQLIDSTGCYALALLIELSRKSDFPSDIWIENVLRVFPKIQVPLELMYITGGLLSPQWKIPSWYF